MKKIYKAWKVYPLLMCFVLFPLVSWAQAKSAWVNPLRQCWVFSSGEMTSFKVASDNDKTIILPTSGGSVTGIDIQKGQIIWNTRIGENLASELTSKNGNILILGSLPTRNPEPLPSLGLFSIDVNSGISSLFVQEEISISNEEVFVMATEKSIVIATRHGQVVAIDKEQRKEIWKRKMELEIVSQPRIHDGKIYFGTTNRSVVVLALDTGNILNQLPIGRVPSRLTIYKNNIYIGDRMGEVRARKIGSSKDQWVTKTGGEISEIVLYKKVILVSSNDNFEYAILRDTGKKIWKRKLAGRIIGKTVIDDEILVLLTHGSKEALFIDLDDGAIVNRITLSESQYFVSPPILLADKLILPTNEGLVAFSPGKCFPDRKGSQVLTRVIKKSPRIVKSTSGLQTARNGDK